MTGILGKKIGMTQIYQEDGVAVPVTVLRAGPCVVVQRKTVQTDGYDAVQLGLVEGKYGTEPGSFEPKAPRKVTQARRGHFAKAGVEPTRRLVEFKVEADSEAAAGDSVDVSIFATDDLVEIVGTSKGKGFQGVMKRHGFGGGRATHGSMFHRAPGSVGQSAYPSRVFPGMRFPGQDGNRRVTTKNLKIVRVDQEENLLFIKGAIPGARNSYVAIRPLRKKG
jgi:large subunit ribosomal protein L3